MHRKHLPGCGVVDKEMPEKYEIEHERQFYESEHTMQPSGQGLQTLPLR
jgi:hypothetical protein